MLHLTRRRPENPCWSIMTSEPCRTQHAASREPCSSVEQ